jgi:hypothetical protein
MSKGTKIDISFPPTPEAQRLYKRVIKTCPDDEKMACHARSLLQKGLDSTTANGRNK